MRILATTIASKRGKNKDYKSVSYIMKVIGEYFIVYYSLASLIDAESKKEKGGIKDLRQLFSLYRGHE